MLNEKLNNDFNWKNKLDGLETLPGEPFNKGVAWNKLHAMLNSESKRKKSAWYFAAAAAVLFFVLLIPLLTHQENESKYVRREAITNNAKRNIKTTPLDDIIIKNSKSESQTDNKEIRFQNQSKQKYSVFKGEIAVKNIQLKDTLQIQLPAKSITELPQPISTLSNVAAVQSVKKELKVIHINELGDPVYDPPDLAKNTAHHSFQLKLANQEVFVNSSIVSKEPGFTLLKSKSSSN